MMYVEYARREALAGVLETIVVKYGAQTSICR